MDYCLIKGTKSSWMKIGYFILFLIITGELVFFLLVFDEIDTFSFFILLIMVPLLSFWCTLSAYRSLPDIRQKKIIERIEEWAMNRNYKRGVKKLEKATKDISLIQQGKSEKPFALYLRPLEFDGGFVISKKFFSEEDRKVFKFSIYDDDDTYEFGDILAKVFQQDIRLISMGQKIIHLSVPSLILSDELWFEEFKKLNSKAVFTIMFPGYGESLISELQWLKENVNLHKVVFVMLNEKSRIVSKPIEEYWEKTVAAWKEVVMNLPTFRADGCIFYYKPDNTYVTFPLTLWNLKPSFLISIFA
jgi:hypothetical protein